MSSAATLIDDRAAGLQHSEHLVRSRPAPPAPGGSRARRTTARRRSTRPRTADASRCLASVEAGRARVRIAVRARTARGRTATPYCWRKGRLAPVPQPASSSRGSRSPAVASSMSGATKRLKPRNQKCRCSASKRAFEQRVHRAHSIAHVCARPDGLPTMPEIIDTRTPPRYSVTAIHPIVYTTSAEENLMRRFLLVGALCAILGLTAAACKRPVPAPAPAPAPPPAAPAPPPPPPPQAGAAAAAAAGAADRRSDLREEDRRSAER